MWLWRVLLGPPLLCLGRLTGLEEPKASRTFAVAVVGTGASNAFWVPMSRIEPQLKGQCAPTPLALDSSREEKKSFSKIWAS